jgi:hypothetical protein
MAGKQKISIIQTSLTIDNISQRIYNSDDNKPTTLQKGAPMAMYNTPPSPQGQKRCGSHKQVKVTIPSDVACAFKDACISANVSMASAISQFMAGFAGNDPPPGFKAAAPRLLDAEAAPRSPARLHVAYRANHGRRRTVQGQNPGEFAGIVSIRNCRRIRFAIGRGCGVAEFNILGAGIRDASK